MNDPVIASSECDFFGTALPYGNYLQSIAERDVDFLLLEEFHSSDAFVRWFCETIGVANADFQHAWHSVVEGDGETDVVLQVKCRDDKVGVFIEDKVGAIEQEKQAERMRKRGKKAMDAGKFHRFVTVICAPKHYLQHLPETSIYDRQVAFEQIADWFAQSADRRYRWKKHVVNEAITKSRRGYVVVPHDVYTQFHTEYADYIDKHHPRLIKIRTKGKQGSNSNWFRFYADVATKDRNLEHILLKSGTHIVRLIVYKKNKPEEMNWDLDKLPAGFKFKALKDSITLYIEVPQVDMSRPFSEQFQTIESILQSAYRLMPYIHTDSQGEP